MPLSVARAAEWNFDRASRATCDGTPRCPLEAGGWFDLLSAYLFGQVADVCTPRPGTGAPCTPGNTVRFAGGWKYGVQYPYRPCTCGCNPPLNLPLMLGGGGRLEMTPAALARRMRLQWRSCFPFFISMGHASAAGSRCLASVRGYRYRSFGLLSLPRSSSTVLTRCMTSSSSTRGVSACAFHTFPRALSLATQLCSNRLPA